ncbi:putative ferulic acid esterase [Tricladium varicosporioides]|nr:putative ferulic acid esterase [Hymenoscyphus varicosporioides]
MAPLISSLFLLASTLTSSLASPSPPYLHSRASGSAGCGKPLPVAQQPAGGASHPTNFTQTNGAKRTYLIHIPSNYNPNTPVPVIFSFHGNGKTSEQQEDLSQFSNEEFNKNAIAVYPQGVDKSWEGAPYAVEGVDDVAFVEDMINHFEDRYCVDSTRIWAAGKSNGGGFTGTLACSSLSPRIAAFAPVSGAFYIPYPSGTTTCPSATSIPIPCSPPASRLPIPVMEFHGTADTVIRYGGGERNEACLPTVPHWVREWSKRDGYGLTNVTTSLYGGNVTKYEYHDGMVTHYLTEGLGHAWPSTEPNGDNSKGTYFNATPIIMEWFGKHTL